MNIENKILEMLTSLDNKVTGLELEISRIRQSVATIEVEHGRALGALLDGYSLHHDKLKPLAPLPDAVRALQDSVYIIEQVVTGQSKDIKNIKEVV